MHSQLHYTHQQLLQYSTLRRLLPRAHRIETKAAVRDHGNCKLSFFLSSVVPLYLLPSSLSLSHSLSVLGFSEKSWLDDCSDIFWSKWNVLDTIYAIAYHHGFYMIEVHDLVGSFFYNSWRSEREVVAGALFGSFTMVGSQTRVGNWISIQSCQSSHVKGALGLLVGVNLVALSLSHGCCPAIV
jgi:hypothetical protein